MTRTEIIDFNVTDAAIADLKASYMPMLVNGIEDKKGLEAVIEARKVVKRYRINVEKRRKELTADALDWQRRINAEAKRITALLEPIENHLAAEEKKVADELERIKREKEEAEIARFQMRVTKLVGLKFMFDGVHYYSTYLDTFNNEVMKVSVLLLKQMSDEVFNDFYDNAKHYFEVHKSEQEEKNRALLEERARLDAIAKQQAEKEAAIKAEAQRLADAKRIADAAERKEVDQKKVGRIVISPDSEMIVIPIEEKPYHPVVDADDYRILNGKIVYSSPFLEMPSHDHAVSKIDNESQNDFDWAIEVVMNVLQCEKDENEADKQYCEHINRIKEAIESALDCMANDKD